MDTGNLGFMIPSIYDIIEFVFFRAIPVMVVVLSLISAIIWLKLKDRINSLFYSNVIVALLIFFIAFSQLSMVSGLVGVSVIIVIFLTVCDAIIVSFYKLYDSKKMFGIMYVLLIFTLFLFFYPKEQNWYRNTEDRVVPAVSCECVGFSEESIYSSEYGFFEARCFGIPIQCRESMQDRCPFLPQGEECITVDASDLS